MKHLANRTLALLMALVLCVGMLSGLTLMADADTVNVEYVTGSTTQYSNLSDIIINWGQRGVTATYLSQNAAAFYEDTTYSELSALSGSELYDALQTLMVSNHEIETTYQETRDLYAFTDCQNSDVNTLTCFYSGEGIGPEWDSGATWNREHTWPNSKGLGGNDENDIMMLRPTKSSINSSRNNKAYGESSGYYNPNVGEYDLRGDVARIALYVYVRWGNENLFGADGVIESQDILLEWVEEDPVDTWELGRNDSVESITGTRNVFVDYPELAFMLFGEEIPSDMTTPSGAAYSSYTVTAAANNASYGTVTCSGNTIVAEPAQGYRIAGYTVTSGTAVVAQNGNVFTVTASSDCTICINFEAKTSAAISYVEDGVIAGEQEVYVGDEVILASHSSNVAAGYTFVGWVSTTVSDADEKPANVYAAGSSFTVAGDTVLYALYSWVDDTSADTSVYELYTGELVEGDYIIESDGGALKAAMGTNNRFAYMDVTIDSNTITDPAAEIVWHIAPTGDGYYTIYNVSKTVYAGGSGAKNKGALLNSVTDFAKWSVSDTYTFENLGNYNKGVNYTLRRNGTYGFACYAPATGTGMSLYKAVSGAVYYTTGKDVPCGHAQTELQGKKDVTCKEAGYTGDVVCLICGETVETGAVIPVDGHIGGTEVRGKKDATCAAEGYTGDTYCLECGDVIAAGTVIDKLGHTYGEHLSDENGHWQVCDCGDKTAVEAHTYGEWVTITEAAVGKEGSKEHSCTVCGYKQTQSIPAIEEEKPTETIQPEDPDQNQENPETGDMMGIAAVLCACVCAAGGICILNTTKKRR